jgi:hypothetical protein
MRVDANMPIDLWPEFIKTAGYLSNRTPVRNNFWKTPYEIVMGEKPKHSHLHPLGCKAYVLNHNIPKKERRNKLHPRAHIGYLVGYDSTHIWRIWIPSKLRVIRTRDVTFDDNSMYSPFDLDIGAVIRESADRIIETLDTDRTDDERVDSDDASTLDFIVVDMPALPESCDHGAEEPQTQQPQLLTLEATPTPEPENTPDDTTEPESANQQTTELPRATDEITET